MTNKFFLTTPIYYVNSAPHLGTTYCTLAADTIRRYHAMLGQETLLVTGSDEHSQNVERAARKKGQSPFDFSTELSDEFKREWDLFHVPYRFIRTSDPRHHATVQWLFERCRANGYIYPSQYTGQYCVNDELYVNDAEPGDPCPDCGRPTETVTEENYFFKLSAFQDRLLQLYEDQPDFVTPDYRRNEIVSFVKGGLRDLSISRNNLTWGIPVPVEGNHVFYVWFDALISYMTAVRDEGWWPADVHLIGKDILRFHAIYWPSFLMAADLPLPGKVVAHGWILKDSVKMSKSRGNVVRPEPLRQVIGADPLRYFLLREIPFGQDGNFSYDALVTRINADLANGLGNLASRTLTMIRQYRRGAVPASSGSPEIAQAATAAVAAYRQSFENYEFHRALESLWSLITVVDKAIVSYQPWILAKKQDPESQARLDEILYSAAEVIRLATALLAPVMPEATANIWSQLGFTGSVAAVRLDQLEWGQLPAGQTIGEIEAVFPRLDAPKIIDQIQEIDDMEVDRINALLGKTDAPAPWSPPPGVAPLAPEIAIDDFSKVDLRVARVLTAAPVKGADKLLHLTVDVAEEQPRTIVAGIAQAYSPEQLIGRKVVIVANLAPRKLRGLTSQGMIVAASLEDTPPVLAAFLEDVPVGARLK
ncbi:MAG: methionine--tRNA ligase [Candidatus Solibacter usitatus]|nr:methionine--tRNA ligase [Candidatus Solibacter usitatus]